MDIVLSTLEQSIDLVPVGARGVGTGTTAGVVAGLAGAAGAWG